MENWSEGEEACNVYMKQVLMYAELFALQYNIVVIEGFWKNNFRRLHSNLLVHHVVNFGSSSELLMCLVQ
jgi:hypothetical protein